MFAMASTVVALSEQLRGKRMIQHGSGSSRYSAFESSDDFGYLRKFLGMRNTAVGLLLGGTSRFRCEPGGRPSRN